MADLPPNDQHPRLFRPHDLVLSNDDVDEALPTPPYRRYSSSVHSDTQTPPYKSRSRVNLMDEKERFKEGTADVSTSTQKPSVHYPDDLARGPALAYATKPLSHRVDSGGGLSSNAPSLAGTDDEDEGEVYDWSDEEDLVDEETKYEEKMGVKKKQRGCFRRVVTFFLSTLIGSVVTSGIIAAAGILVRVLYLRPNNPDGLDRRQYVTDNVEAWLFWAAANLLISWFLGLIIDIIPGIFTWAIFLIWGQVTEVIKTRVEMYNSVKDPVKPVFYAASGWASWVIIFAHIFKLYDLDNESSSRASYTPRVYQAIEFLFFFALVVCAQRMLSHMIALAFHQTAFKERIQSIKKNLKTIDHLRDYRPKNRHVDRSSKMFGSGHSSPALALSTLGFGGATPQNEKSEFMAGHSRVGTPDTEDEGHAADFEDNLFRWKGKGKKGQSRPRISVMGASSEDQQHTYPPKPSPIEGTDSPRRPGTPIGRKSHDDEAAIVHAAKVLKTAVLHDARNLTGKENEDVTGLGWSVGSAHEAKRLARSIYMAFKTDRRRTYLIAEDFYPAYPTVEEAKDAFRVFDKDNNGDISRAEIKTTIVKTYRERRFLSRSMRDVSAALRTLDHILLFFALVILFFISLSVFNVNVEQSLSSVYTIGIGASFIFKNSASNVFDAIMFLFVTHPFDTGDRCFIDDENLVVKKMGLFATVFTRADGTETYYFNSQLFNKFITNARRSDKTGELCTLQIAWRTPIEKIDALEKCLNEWLSTEENRWYEPNTSVTLQKIEYQRHLEITIGIPHNSNWQDWGLRNTRKTAFYAAANYYCRQLGIHCVKSTMPVVFVGATDSQGEMPMSPTSAVTGENEDVAPLEAAEAKELKPMLGFLPPPEKRTALLRVRKRKGRKDAFKASGAEG